MESMDGCFFAFAEDDGFFYGTPKTHVYHKLKPSLVNDLVKYGASHYTWAAFGPGEENCFFSHKTKDGSSSWILGDDSPSSLKDWLCEAEEMDPHVRVSLGPNGSFVAWDSKRIRWDNVPKGLERTIQSWLSPTGWTAGAPRIITLGANDAWFALSQYGSVAYSIPASLTKTFAGFTKLEEKIEKGEMRWQDLEVLSLSSCTPDYFVWFKDVAEYSGDIPEPVLKLAECIVTMLPSELRAAYLEEMRQGAKAEEDKEKQERIRRAKEEEEKARRESRAREELALVYVMWRSGWEEDSKRNKLLTTFPHIPRKACQCAEPSCTVSKEEPGSLRACRHDVEKVLRSSEIYSYSWLRRERLFWHPDRFAQRCDPDFRKELISKAKEMYQIYEILIEQEVRAGRATVDPRSPEPSPNPKDHAKPPGSTDKKDLGRTATATRAFSSANLRFQLGDMITNITFTEPKYWRGSCAGKEGLFPSAFVRLDAQV